METYERVLEALSDTTRRRILTRLRERPCSVAEIAAYSRLPIGSARVIIGDMLGLGLLVLCSNQVTAESPSMELMARVREGLRNL